jgi:ATP-binding cassette subfamily B protein
LAQNATKATIIISHRLSTVQHADEIVVFEDGRIVERGNHTELLSMSGHYCGLWFMQAGLSEESDSDGDRDISQPDLDVEMDALEAGRMEEVL